MFAGVAYSVGRGRGPGALDSIWAEDGHDFLGDAANLASLDAITTSLNGYYHLYARLLAEVTTLFPVSWWAAINTWWAVLSTVALAVLVYGASAAHLRDSYLRLLVAAPLVVQFVAHGAAANNVATLQFPALYALFWLLLQVQTRRLARIGAPVVALLIALSTTLVVALIPLAVARVALRRDRAGVLLAGALFAGVAFQLAGLAAGDADRGGIGYLRIDPLWVIHEFVRVQLPVSVLGEAWIRGKVVHHGEHLALILLAWGVVVAAAGVAVSRRSLPVWPLAAVASVHAVAIFGVQVTLIGSVPDRYLVASMPLVIVVLVALMRPTRPTAAAPIVALSTLLVVVSLANYRLDSTRTKRVPSWTAQVRQATVRCKAEPSLSSIVVLSGPRHNIWGTVRLPCDRLR
ncbi:hypothetical protein [Micromonospora sp. CPCC 206061]|uniref:hypothetical protein n=1 Tax=Micromonospora sp. CPCC 206061 TaxID=3122410 RepID=UPI002FF2E2C9